MQFVPLLEPFRPPQSCHSYHFQTLIWSSEFLFMNIVWLPIASGVKSRLTQLCLSVCISHDVLHPPQSTPCSQSKLQAIPITWVQIAVPCTWHSLCTLPLSVWSISYTFCGQLLSLFVSHPLWTTKWQLVFTFKMIVLYLSFSITPQAADLFKTYFCILLWL